MSQITMLPIEQLVVTGTNARKDHIADKAMIASLKSQGLLYPLLVEVLEDGKYDVVDGARRLTCILDGVESGELDAGVWRNIPCLKGNGDGRKLGLEQSLHANLHMSMHPLDECEAILLLAQDEDDKAAIALRFGQDEKWLDQRVKLADLADEVKKLFRAGEISLTAAMAFTLGSPAQQKAFLRATRNDGFSTSMIAPAMTEKAVNAKYVNFDLKDYPENKIQRDLFSEEVFLLDRKKVAELQDDWAAATIAELKELGYDEVKALASDDWQTLQAHVKVEGEITPEARSRLKCFLKRDHYGYINVYEGLASRKAVAKEAIRKDKHAQDSVDGEAKVKPLLCTELTVAQQEIVNAYAASDLYTQVIEGDELLARYLVIANQFGGQWTEAAAALRHNGTVSRWARLNKDYPAEQLIQASEAGPWEQSFEQFMALPETDRDDLYRQAVASMIHSPYGQQVPKLKGVPELARNDWLQPGSDFFKRYRTDQLIDYRKRSGDRDAGKTVKKKGDHVADCVVAATTPGAFKLGLYPKKLQIPVSGRKRKGGLPDEA